MGKLQAVLFVAILSITFTGNAFAKDSEKDCEAHLSAAVSAAHAFQKYFSEVDNRLYERGGILTSLQVALLAKEHALLMGPPGNAKSMISDIILGNITDEEGKPSYYRIQMTPETTMSETHGPIDPKAIFESGVIKRHYDQGMLLSRNVFIDEIFDARANAQRNILGLLNERQHAQGTEIVKGDIETAIGATNRYLDEVYEKAGDQSPKALLDRFSFTIYVPGEFQFAESYRKLIAGAGKDRPKLPPLTFEQLDALRELTGQVEIPHAVSEFLSLLSYKIKTQTEAMEQAALKVYRKKQQNGENPPPPYRATKYHSPRTLDKAAKILRAIVVQNWIQSGGKRPLTATVEDLKQLKSFFTLSGPEGNFTQDLLDRTVNPYERSQLSAIMQESQLFDETYIEIAQDMNEVVYRYALVDLDGEISSASSEEEKKQLVSRMSETWLNIKSEGMAAEQAQRGGKEVGQVVVTDFLEAKLRELVGSEFEATLNAKAEEIQERKRQEVLEAKRRADAAVAEQKRKELEARRAKEAAERQARIDAFMQNRLMTAVKSGEGLELVAELRGAQFTNPVATVPGFSEHNQIHVSLKDQILVFAPGSAGFRFRANGSIETIEYEKAVPDAVMRALLSGQGERILLALDDKRFVVKRANMLAIVDAETFKAEHFVMLESDGKFAVDPEKKFAVNFNMATNRLERIDLTTGAVEQMELQFADIANQVNYGDILFMSGKDSVSVTFNQGRWVRSGNLSNMQHHQVQTLGANIAWSALQASADGKRVFAGLLHGTVLYHSEMKREDMLNAVIGQTQAKQIEVGMTNAQEIIFSPTGSHIAICNGTGEARIADTTTNEVAILRSPNNFLQTIASVVWLDSSKVMLKGYDGQHRQSYQILQLKPPTAEELKRIAQGE